MDQTYLILVAATICLWIAWMIFPSADESVKAETRALQAGSYTVTGLIIFIMCYESSNLTLILLMLLICAPMMIYDGIRLYKSDKKKFATSTALSLSMLIVFMGYAWFYHW